MAEYIAATQELDMLLCIKDADMGLAMTGENIEEIPSIIRHQHQVELPQKAPSLNLKSLQMVHRAPDREIFDSVIEEGKTAKDAPLMAGINMRTVQHYLGSDIE